MDEAPWSYLGTRGSPLQDTSPDHRLITDQELWQADADVIAVARALVTEAGPALSLAAGEQFHVRTGEVALDVILEGLRLG
jgi:hypothetical protein